MMNSVRRAVGVIVVRSFSSKPVGRPKLKPKEIPFQPKVSNSVNLIGQVAMPLQFQTAPDGHTWAATVITRPNSPPFSPYLWIPVIFEGDLAHTAFVHLKLNDFIHIAGQLTTDPPYLLPDPPQTNVQVMVQTLNFVRGCPQDKDTSAISNQEQLSTLSPSEKHNINQSREGFHSKQTEENNIDKSWNDLLLNPIEWWDVRSTKENPKGAAFERKMNGELLFINSSTPKWLQEKLESMTIDLKPELRHSISGEKKDLESSLNSWRDLLDDPKQWSDFRDRKLNGLVNPKFPDFKRKDGSVSLWLNRAPKWVLSELEGLEFDVPVVKSKQAKDGKEASEKHDINQAREDFHSKRTEEHGIDESWKDLLLNPIEWWDVRSSKENPKDAAFERKTNGELLFINSSTPKWLQVKLESMTIDLKPELKDSISGGKKDLDSKSSWRNLLADPKQWSDFRDSKLNGLVNSKFPDFKRKDSSVSLWLNGAPKWVLFELEGLKFDVPVVKSKQAKDSKGDQLWNDLLNNPDKWWDNRSNKRNERSPDFKHKETGEVLWLKGSPSWVLPKLPPLKPKQNVEIGRKQTLVS